ncbi:MAG TPA: PIN domain-containing protein [Syntrophorhabdaceae bacterium]|jgi:hypothetical protein|nr:PIN domain-containing protein [Syntrophorhabdaceae bacterium]HQM82233.1 PIN domain-containing protein [Syntrophorhabdaceae bacterium]
MPVLVDTSVWIDYLRNGKKSEKVDFLIDENIVAINDLILAELVPFLKIRNQREIINILYAIDLLKIEIDWSEIIDFQTKCLNDGINGIGIPDLIIAQNSKQHRCEIYSFDNHFRLMQKTLDLLLFP